MYKQLGNELNNREIKTSESEPEFLLQIQGSHAERILVFWLLRLADYGGCISTPEVRVLATNSNGKHWAALKEVMVLSMNC